MVMKCLQINLHHCKAASAALILRLGTRGEDIALIQEPWTHNGKILGLSAKQYKLIYSNRVNVNGSGNIRACILAKKHLNVFILPDFSDVDTVTVACELGGSPIWIISSYFPHDYAEPPPNKLTMDAVLAANVKKTAIVIGADANAHHSLWGSSDTNTRGESIFDFVLNNNLVVVNRGSEPTFVVTNRQEVLDITCISAHKEHLIINWKVSEQCSLSDHRYLEFTIDIAPNKLLPFMNRKKTNWNIHKRILSGKLNNLPNIHNIQSIEDSVKSFTSSIKDAIKKSCKPSLQRGKTKPPWFSHEIAEHRKKCRILFNEAKRTGVWLPYKSSVNHFKNMVRDAKRNSWRDFCSNIEGSSETNRLRKFLSKSPSVIGYIQKLDGSWTSSGKETLDELMDTHFPGCMNCDNSLARSLSYIQSHVHIPINMDRLHWAIHSFSPYKSPGPDGIIPADLQQNIELVSPWLLSIYSSCLEWSFIPDSWIKCEVIFIPKGGKASHSKAKDFRPITLSSFLLKILERIVDIHIRMSINPSLVSPSQHAYTKGKSVETALHSLVGFIERSLEFKNQTLVAFLDIEGAFNNVNPPAIISALTELDLDNNTIGFVTDLLTHRIIRSKIGEAITLKSAKRGTPQGGVLSPLLWNVVINKLLVELDSLGFKTVAYADDVAIAISGFDLNTISQRMNSGLKLISDWSNNCGLGVNAAKTELVLFSRKYKIPSFKLPVLNGVTLSLSDSAKYLGIIIDCRLNWHLNTQSRTSKALTAAYVCKRAIGKNWGIKPKYINWMVEAVVKPILFYGSIVWWNSVNCGPNHYGYMKTLRTLAIMITGALRTTSTVSLFAILNWNPVDLMAKELATKAALRLNITGNWNRRSFGHAMILETVNTIPDNIDYCSPKNFLTRQFSFLISEQPAIISQIPEEGVLDIFTDGSKNTFGVGGGVFIEEYDIYMSFRLPDECTILQAEVSAIKRAANWLRYYRIFNRNIQIYTDSQAAIKALSGAFSASNLVQECRTSLNEMARHSNITLIWVRGHGASHGNNIADSLAKEGTKLNDSCIDHFCGIPLIACKTRIKQYFFNIAQLRWSEVSSSKVTKKMWPALDPKKTSFLIGQSRTNVQNLIAVITGHCKFGTHASRLGLQFNNFCRSCLNTEEAETILHLLCKCPALCALRMESFGHELINDLIDIPAIGLDRILHFIQKCEWFL